MTPAAAAARRAVQSRNATEEAILDAAREALAEKGFDSLTMDAIARKAFVSRTAVYFYFPNKRAVVDRLIQHAFSEMYLAASPYLDGDGDPRKELYAGLARVVSTVNRHARVLLLAAALGSGAARDGREPRRARRGRSGGCSPPTPRAGARRGRLRGSRPGAGSAPRG